MQAREARESGAPYLLEPCVVALDLFGPAGWAQGHEPRGVSLLAFVHARLGARPSPAAAGRGKRHGGCAWGRARSQERGAWMDAAGWKTRPPLHGGCRLRATGLQHGLGGWGALPGSAAVPGRRGAWEGHGGCARGRARSQGTGRLGARPFPAAAGCGKGMEDAPGDGRGPRARGAWERGRPRPPRGEGKRMEDAPEDGRGPRGWGAA